MCGIETFAILLEALTLLAVAAPAFSRFRQCGDAIGWSCPSCCYMDSGTNLFLGTESIGIALQLRYNDLGSVANIFNAVFIVVALDTTAQVSTLNSIGEALRYFVWCGGYR